MAVPEIEGIQAVVGHRIEILCPEGFIIEPGEVLWRIGIFVRAASGQQSRFLQADTGAAEVHAGLLGYMEAGGPPAGPDTGCEIETAVKGAGSIRGPDDGFPARDVHSIRFLRAGMGDGDRKAAALSGGRSKLLFSKFHSWLR